MARKPYPSSVANQVMVRMPDGMRPEIKSRAAENQRSMNSEIIYLLKKAMEADKNEAAKAA